MAKIPQKQKPVQIEISFEGEPEKIPPLAAYIFNRQGKLVQTTDISDGNLELSLDEDRVKRTRLFIAPRFSVEKESPRVSVGFLERRNAYSPVVQYDAIKKAYVIPPIPEDIWRCWPWRICHITGTVVRPVAMEDTTVDKPVCNARVHICEVDPIWLIFRRIPDDIILRIRESLLVELKWPRPPGPDPGPEFVFDAGIRDPRPENVAMTQRQTAEGTALLNPRLVIPGQRFRVNTPVTAGGMVSSLPAISSQESTGTMTVQDTVLLKALSTSSAVRLREILTANIDIIRPYFCYWPWFWPWLVCDEIAVVNTDNLGRFSSYILYSVYGDHPDLYFWVEYYIGDVWTRVYHPPKWCHTYWNYACNTEVRIPITDPRVPWCAGDLEVGDSEVRLFTIGNYIRPGQVQDNASGKAGLVTTDVTDGDTTFSVDRPFAGSIEPHVGFGNDLISHNITHYRWSFRKLNAAGVGSGGWTVLDHEVIRHYYETLGYQHWLKVFVLGPDPAFPGKTLFKIRPNSPPKVDPDSIVSWMPEVNGRTNTASAFFLTHLLDGGNAETAAGKYELKLELFDGSGSRIDIAKKVGWVWDFTVRCQIPEGEGSIGDPLPAFVERPIGEEYYVLDATKTVVEAFRIVLHVDNNICHAGIDDVIVGGVPAEACGFIQYTPASTTTPAPTAGIGFLAKHPNNFAWVKFQISRGNTGAIKDLDAIGPVGISPLGIYTRNPATSRFSNNAVPLSTLLGSCTRAAFAETIYVSATATDGWSWRLSYLDAPRPGEIGAKAFALEPKP